MVVYDMLDFSKHLMRKASRMIQSTEFRERHKSNIKDFTRNRKLGFSGIVSVVIGIMVKSLQLALEDFRELFMPGVESYTKQAFSLGRAKIHPSAFKELFKMTAVEAWEKDAVGKIDGRRFFAIDGTDLMLPQSAEIWGKFKGVSGSRLPHARASFFYDVVSGYVLDACFDKIETDERTMAYAHFDSVKQYLSESDVVLLDRGYPSKDLIAYCFENGIHFLMRLQQSFNAEVDASREQDFIWQMSYNGKRIPVRVIKMWNEDNESTTLITNLFEKGLSPEDLRCFYALRWSIETRFSMLKVKLEVEKFSGKTIASLEQDFFARLFLMNIEAAIKADSDALIAAKDRSTPRKYRRKTNETILFGMLRKRISACLLTDDDPRRDAMVDKLILDASQYKTSIRPGRSFKRTERSHKRTTESPKRCL